MTILGMSVGEALGILAVISANFTMLGRTLQRVSSIEATQERMGKDITDEMRDIRKDIRNGLSERMREVERHQAEMAATCKERHHV